MNKYKVEYFQIFIDTWKSLSFWLVLPNNRPNKIKISSILWSEFANNDLLYKIKIPFLKDYVYAFCNGTWLLNIKISNSIQINNGDYNVNIIRCWDGLTPVIGMMVINMIFYYD